MAKHPKSPEARRAEVDAILAQLNPLQIPESVRDSIASTLNDFARTGQSYSAKVPIQDTPVAIVYLLSNQAHVTSHVRITKA